MAIKYIKVTMV